MGKQFKILSLDGGGVRGIVVTSILEELVEKYPTILEEVDLVTGTSIGGIIALSLASGKKSPAECSTFLMENAKKIFPFKSYRNPTTWLRSKYSNSELERLLEEILGDTKLKDIPKNILIPTYQIRNAGKGTSVPSVFHNLQSKDQGFRPVANARAVDVAMQTSAAPTIFPEYKNHIDGGVWANNPSLVAAIYAVQSGVSFEDIVILSIGTGQFNKPPMKKGSHGLLQWGSNLIDLFMNGNSQLVDQSCSVLMKSRYFRLQPSIDNEVALDDSREMQDLKETATTYIQDVLENANFKHFMQGKWIDTPAIPTPPPEPILSPLSVPQQSTPHQHIDKQNQFRFIRGMGGSEKVMVDHLPPEQSTLIARL